MTNKVNWAVSWTFLDHQEYCSPLLERSKQIPTVSNWPIWPLHSLQRNLSRLHVEVIRRIFHPACDGPGGAIIIFITPINCFKNTDVRDGAAHVGTICVKRNLVILMEKTTKVHTQHNQPKLKAFNKEIVQFEGEKNVLIFNLISPFEYSGKYRGLAKQSHGRTWWKKLKTDTFCVQEHVMRDTQTPPGRGRP